MRRILPLPVAIALCLASLALTGCGSGGSTVSGDVVSGAVKLNTGDKVVIMLTGEGQSYSGEANESGKFSIPDVKPGRYQVSYIHYTATPAPSGPPKPGTPPGGGPTSTSTPKQYPDEWTVPGGPYTLDLSKVELPKGKK